MTHHLSPPHGRGAPGGVERDCRRPRRRLRQEARPQGHDPQRLPRRGHDPARRRPGPGRVRAGRGAALPDRPEQRLPGARQVARRRDQEGQARLVGVQEATTWRRGADGVKDGPATPATQVVYDSATELLKALKKAGAPYKQVVEPPWFDFEAPTALGYDVRITQRDVILVRKGSKVKVTKTFKGGFTNHFDPPTCAVAAPELRGWVGVDGKLARHKFRFVSTHLEAYSPAIADQQMQELLKKSGPLGSKKRQSILVGDFNSAPGANANDRGTARDANAYDSGDRRRLPQPAAEAQDVLLRGGPAPDDGQARDVDRPRARAAEDQGRQVRHRRHQAGRRPVPLRPRGHHRHAASKK